MNKEELKSKIEEIRQLLIKSDLDGATEKLTALAARFGDDAHDEAITINANWNELERKIRSALIHENEARIRQNQLIDQILDFSRELEDYRSPKPSPPKPASAGKTGIYIVGLVVLFLLALIAFNWYNKSRFVQKTQRETEQTTTLPQNTESTKAQRPAEVPRQYDAPPSSPKTTSPKEATTQEPPVKTPSSRPAQENTQKYDQYYSQGVYAYNRKEYEKAYELFQAALKIKVTEEVREYTRPLAEKLYNKYRIKGMDLYNAGNYAAAKEEFKKAQHYKDFSAIRGLINKCEKQLN